MPPRHLALIAAGAFLPAIPLLMFQGGGDIFFHHILIECFSEQLWTGQFYPRWCFSANAGLGAPLFFFYFPLPYYLTALLYPLHWLGLSLDGIYFLSAWLACAVGGITLYFWLQDWVPRPYALACTLVYLLLPYRLELLLFRSGFSELWFTAWLPLVMRDVRRLALSSHYHFIPLACSLALCFLSHLPGGVIACIASATYLLVKRGQLRALAALGWAILLALLLCAFYLLPAITYKPFSHIEAYAHHRYSWPNNFVTLQSMMDRPRVIAGSFITVAMLVFLVSRLWQKHQEGDAHAWRSEHTAWAALCGLAFVMLFPISQPLWRIIDITGLVSFPWRMQIILNLGLIYFLAAHWPIVAESRLARHPRANLAALLFLMTFSGFFLSASRDPAYRHLFTQLMEARYVYNYREYVTKWTDREHASRQHILRRLHRRAIPLPKAEALEGEALVKVIQWSAQGIGVEVNASTPSVIRLDHYYFPAWRVNPEGNITLSPEDGTGRMLLHIPTGDYSILLTPETGPSGKIGFLLTLAGMTILFGSHFAARKQKLAL